MSALTSLLSFVVAIGVLVTVHEFGHYWVARRMGVKVLRFSVGFGRPLLRWVRGADRTEYVISAIPLGGYVKMLDEREGPVAEEEAHRAFNRKSLGARSAVVVAGPLFNFAFALLAYWLVFLTGSTVLRPVVDAPPPHSPAAVAELRAGDEILRVDGEIVRSWEEALFTLLERGLGGKVLALQVESAEGARRELRLPMPDGLLREEGDVLARLGLRPWRPVLAPVFAEVRADTPAAAAGLRAGDRVLAANGEPIADWTALVRYLEARPGGQVRLSLRRDGAAIERQVTLEAVERDGRQVGRLGVIPEVPEGLYDRVRAEVRYGPLEAVSKSARATWQASALTVKVLGRMLIGDASLKNLSGPINIAQYAGESASLGLAPFLKFLAIISISLGILNLLPVPVLDGGHLLYFGIEALRGRPLSEQAQLLGQQIGMALLLMLMALAFYNDIVRLLAG
ncbi:RIP metalloprotease RseP [Alkalilimnicola sp. S0819]|uniref:RIP metalloprotease RseP n=1 Tax=Alkalilimnicola sp. S0819 TaxID=2613922 RepID=UPI001261B3F6|nr:RIP metalloprotease RseP [Alkalilimnicola sp. S0819]KAB7627923.1 RIP metalloprotease RseP [Alkalilimnicola sp. S0819]MPQ15559.1 RIP metalloprotease RseP [Alkalilimnicola sp. S0819]